MPAEDVYSVLRNNYPDLVGRVLDKHEEISKFLMLFYAHLLNIASEKSEPLANLKCDVSILEKEGRHLICIQSDFTGESDATVTKTKNPIQRNVTLASLLISNSSVREVARRVVEVLEQWCASNELRKTQGLFNVRLDNAMFWRGSFTCTAEIVLKVEFDQLVKDKMKWADDEPDAVGGIIQ